MKPKIYWFTPTHCWHCLLRIKLGGIGVLGIGSTPTDAYEHFQINLSLICSYFENRYSNLTNFEIIEKLDFGPK